MNEIRDAAKSLGDMPAEEFRARGHQLIDWIADFLANISDLPAFPDVQPGDISAKPPATPPIKGEAMEEILADVDRVIMPGMAHWNHLRFSAIAEDRRAGVLPFCVVATVGSTSCTSIDPVAAMRATRATRFGR